jgi:hypothetical protein
MYPLAKETALYRCHQKRFPPEAFNPVASHQYYGGGRFDATKDDSYPFMYVGLTIDCAVVETLLRDLPNDESGAGQLPTAAVSGRRISLLFTTADTELVDLRDLRSQRAVAQDNWLPTADPDRYPQTRHWGHWIRAQVPVAAGFIWRSRRDPALESIVLFGDRVPAGVVEPVPPTWTARPQGFDFDDYNGRRALRDKLAEYRVALGVR